MAPQASYRHRRCAGGALRWPVGAAAAGAAGRRPQRRRRQHLRRHHGSHDGWRRRRRLCIVVPSPTAGFGLGAASWPRFQREGEGASAGAARARSRNGHEARLRGLRLGSQGARRQCGMCASGAGAAAAVAVAAMNQRRQRRWKQCGGVGCAEGFKSGQMQYTPSWCQASEH